MASVARWCCCGEELVCFRCSGATPSTLTGTFSGVDLSACGCLFRASSAGRYGKVFWNAGFSNATINTAHTLTQSALEQCRYEKTIDNCILQKEYTSLANCNADIPDRVVVLNLLIFYDLQAYAAEVKSTGNLTLSGVTIFVNNTFTSSPIDCENIAYGPFANQIAACVLNLSNRMQVDAGGDFSVVT